jgi:hypothetical protein
MENINIIEAKSEHAEGACKVLIKSIKEVCAPDYNNDKEIITK